MSRLIDSFTIIKRVSDDDDDVWSSHGKTKSRIVKFLKKLNVSQLQVLSFLIIIEHIFSNGKSNHRNFNSNQQPHDI